VGLFLQPRRACTEQYAEYIYIMSRSSETSVQHSYSLVYKTDCVQTHVCVHSCVTNILSTRSVYLLTSTDSWAELTDSVRHTQLHHLMSLVVYHCITLHYTTLLVHTYNQWVNIHIYQLYLTHVARRYNSSQQHVYIYEQIDYITSQLEYELGYISTTTTWLSQSHNIHWDRQTDRQS